MSLTKRLEPTGADATAAVIAKASSVSSDELCPNLDELYEVHAADFIAVIPASWLVTVAQERLLIKGLSLPIPVASCTLARSIGWNEPVGWRDWVLGFSGVTAAGQIVKSGARVTKSVAGFEIHKFVVGSRDAFLFPLSYTLRVVPVGREVVLPEGRDEAPLSEPEKALITSLKSRFDPTNKLNPGVWGFI